MFVTSIPTCRGDIRVPGGHTIDSLAESRGFQAAFSGSWGPAEEPPEASTRKFVVRDASTPRRDQGGKLALFGLVEGNSGVPHRVNRVEMRVQILLDAGAHPDTVASIGDFENE